MLLEITQLLISKPINLVEIKELNIEGHLHLLPDSLQQTHQLLLKQHLLVQS